MTRDDFLDLLARSVSDGTITEAQAAELLALFDAGELDLSNLAPLPPAQTGGPIQDEHVALALGLLASVLNRPAEAAARTAGRMALVQRIEMVTVIQDTYQAEARRLASRLTTRQLSLADWQQEAADEIRQRILAMHQAGAGRETLTRAGRGRLADIVRREEAFLSRFADEIAVRQAMGEPLSEAQIGARLGTYGGEGRGEFFRAYEEAEVGGEFGIVALYRSQDDPSTCSPCLQAELDGPYLPGTDHPVPGSVCLGGSRCRCVLEYVYDPAAYEGLV